MSRINRHRAVDELRDQHVEGRVAFPGPRCAGPHDRRDHERRLVDRSQIDEADPVSVPILDVAAASTTSGAWRSAAWPTRAIQQRPTFGGRRTGLVNDEAELARLAALDARLLELARRALRKVR